MANPTLKGCGLPGSPSSGKTIGQISHGSPNDSVRTLIYSGLRERLPEVTQPRRAVETSTTIMGVE